MKVGACEREKDTAVRQALLAKNLAGTKGAFAKLIEFDLMPCSSMACFLHNII